MKESESTINHHLSYLVETRTNGRTDRHGLKYRFYLSMFDMYILVNTYTYVFIYLSNFNLNIFSVHSIYILLKLPYSTKCGIGPVNQYQQMPNFRLLK